MEVKRFIEEHVIIEWNADEEEEFQKERMKLGREWHIKACGPKNIKVLCEAPDTKKHGYFCELYRVVEEYTEPIKFTSTGRFGCGPKHENDVYTIKEFKQACEEKSFIDTDGIGYPVKDSKCNPNFIICPSMLHEIPADATHIVWYNQ